MNKENVVEEGWYECFLKVYEDMKESHVFCPAMGQAPSVPSIQLGGDNFSISIFFGAEYFKPYDGVDIIAKGHHAFYERLMFLDLDINWCGETDHLTFDRPMKERSKLLNCYRESVLGTAFKKSIKDNLPFEASFKYEAKTGFGHHEKGVIKISSTNLNEDESKNFPYYHVRNEIEFSKIDPLLRAKYKPEKEMDKEKEFFTQLNTVIQDSLTKIAGTCDEFKLHPCSFQKMIEGVFEDIVVGLRKNDEKMRKDLTPEFIEQYREHVKSTAAGKVPIVFMGDEK